MLIYFKNIFPNAFKFYYCHLFVEFCNFKIMSIPKFLQFWRTKWGNLEEESHAGLWRSWNKFNMRGKRCLPTVESRIERRPQDAAGFAAARTDLRQNQQPVSWAIWNADKSWAKNGWPTKRNGGVEIFREGTTKTVEASIAAGSWGCPRHRRYHPSV